MACTAPALQSHPFHGSSYSEHAQAISNSHQGEIKSLPVSILQVDAGSGCLHMTIHGRLAPGLSLKRLRAAILK